MQFEYPVGATPLDADESEGLLPKHIHLQSELNEWEEANILEAESWGFARKHSDILSFNFCLKLHKKMFGKTWAWAGKFRRSNKNIGVLWEQVATHIKLLFDDTIYQIKYAIYPIDEIATRFHHRLVSIHPFPNGNGRHARLMTDILLYNCGSTPFNWGQNNGKDAIQARNQYLRALRAADKGDLSLLFKFVRSE